MRSVSRLSPTEPRSSLIILMISLLMSVVIAPLIIGRHPIVATIFSCLMLIGMLLSLTTLTVKTHDSLCFKTSGISLILLVGYTLIANLPTWQLIIVSVSMIFHLAKWRC